MENKYYTPELEEFHIGFEYYLKDSDGKPVKPKQVLNKDLMILVRSETLVKYLDREDIESLGWKLKTTEKCKFTGKDINIYSLLIECGFNNGIVWNLIQDSTGLEIKSSTYSHYSNNSQTMFFKIKNKSELKKLMKQLNIN